MEFVSLALAVKVLLTEHQADMSLAQNIKVSIIEAPIHNIFPDRTAIVAQQRVDAENARLKAEAEAEAARQAAIRADFDATANRMLPFGSYAIGNYTPGNCTFYVSSRLPVPPSMGNARDWGWNLLASGWRSGGPRRGAVGVSTFGWAGHVVVVENVDEWGNVLISEMNYEGLGRVDSRWTYAGEFSYYF